MSSGEKLRQNYRVGDWIFVKIIEHIGDKAWIVGVEGMLLQVQNFTLQDLREGQTVRMRVVSLNPPQLSFT